MTKTIQRVWRIDDVFTSVTSAKLSDETGTYGVKRDDTDAVVVADGVNMTETSTGVYEYSFSEPVPGLDYTAWVEFVYNAVTYRFEHDITYTAPTPDLTFPVTEGYGDYGYLMREVGVILGLNRRPLTWDYEQSLIADSIVQRGVRQFYVPPPLPGERFAHEWSFLKPIQTITTEAEDYTYNLGSDFSMLDGPMTFAPGENVLFQPIELVAEYQVRRKQSLSTSTGRPAIVAIRPTGTIGQWEAIFWPTPDDAYTIKYRCKIVPADLGTSNITPYGGDEHTATILEACLALAEDEAKTERPVHSIRFQERLQASISHDRGLSVAETLGIGRDRSDKADFEGTWHDFDSNIVTYNDIEY